MECLHYYCINKPTPYKNINAYLSTNIYTYSINPYTMNPKISINTYKLLYYSMYTLLTIPNKIYENEFRTKVTKQLKAIKQAKLKEEIRARKALKRKEEALKEETERLKKHKEVVSTQLVGVLCLSQSNPP